MKTSSAKNKGRRLCRYAATRLQEWFGLSANDVRVTSSGAPGVDLLLSDNALEKFPFAVECKNQERIQIHKALEQAQSNAHGAIMPLLIFSRNRSEVYVALKLDDFLHWGSR